MVHKTLFLFFVEIGYIIRAYSRVNCSYYLYLVTKVYPPRNANSQSDLFKGSKGS